MMGGLRPPAGASQGKADYFVPGTSPSPPASSEQATYDENEVAYEYGEEFTIPVTVLHGN